VGTVARWLFISVWLVVVIVPYAWVALASVKPRELLSRPTFEAFTPQFETWADVLASPIREALYRSAFVGLGTVAVAVVLGSLGAYAISRFRTGGPVARYGVLASQVIPPVVLVIPLFLIAFQFGLNDTPLAIAAAHLTFVLPLVTWFLIGFFDEVPPEFEEQARVDGYTRFQAFRKVVLPQVRPGIGAAAIFGFILSWNDLFYALILGGGRARTLPVAIAGYNTFRGVELGAMSVAILLSVLPVLIASFFVQRRLIRGLGGGGVKG
jgi:ABC-type glycerol-3-phosphate transport system permease component